MKKYRRYSDYREDELGEIRQDIFWKLEMKKKYVNGQLVEVRPITNDSNLSIVLHEDPLFASVAKNMLSGEITVDAPGLPWYNEACKAMRNAWDDTYTTKAAVFLMNEYRFKTDISFNNLSRLIESLAVDNAFNPIADYFDALPLWDGVDRLDGLFPTYWGVKYSKLCGMATRVALCGAYKRAIEPGIKYETMLIIAGDQGLGKGTLLRKLAVFDDWFSDSISLNDFKDAKVLDEKLSTIWFSEISELDNFDKASDALLKSTLSCQNTVYRDAYARQATIHRRHSVFFGSVNIGFSNGFLHDTTGNRRYVVLRGSAERRKKFASEITREEIDQIWAQVKYLCEVENYEIYPEAHASRDAELNREWNESLMNSMSHDSSEDEIIAYLSMPMLKSAAEFKRGSTLYSRQSYFEGYCNNGGGYIVQYGSQWGTPHPDEEVIFKSWVTCTEVCQEALGLEKPSKKDKSRVDKALVTLGWKKRKNDSDSYIKLRRPYSTPTECYFAPEGWDPKANYSKTEQ